MRHMISEIVGGEREVRLARGVLRVAVVNQE